LDENMVGLSLILKM